MKWRLLWICSCTVLVALLVWGFADAVQRSNLPARGRIERMSYKPPRDGVFASYPSHFYIEFENGKRIEVREKTWDKYSVGDEW